jgi:hypothetical protein
MFNRTIEIHDSILASVSISQGLAELHFSRVYIHQAEGEPGRDAGTVWVQEALLRISDADVNGAFSELPVDLDGGELRMEEFRSDNEIPIPLQFKGEFELRLEAWRQAQEVVTFRGSGAQLGLIGEPEYVEEFRP